MIDKKMFDKIFRDAMETSKALDKEYENMRIENAARIAETRQTINQKAIEFQERKKAVQSAFRFIRNK
ncbi:hypothetical protein [Anoxybacillus flavithermus]|jgi:cell division protein FtsL|uniref:hypothetical protein n=1 Tax=Anoxybacillus flavithermus TaxID=33934 RepID=UPI00186632C4|nr:hypothetical protein [Anoxybacillus flavithermus]MBE2912676.1 hypothetical protein [Anoxybacillus flavithermus]